MTASESSGPPAAEGLRRRDIDGLRAVAILAVLGYHANPRWAPGGFVGVDIFFVISGYLISGIIFQALQTGSFSFARFYSRRIKRIFPALLLVLVFVVLCGWLALYSDEYQALGKHVAAGAGFLSNIILWKEAGYFDVAGEFKPLLHLWSLGIEEQFYLLWPPLLYLAWRRSKNLLGVIAAITIASFALNVYWVGAHEVRTFYLPVTRLWELSLGGMLAVVQIPGGTLAAYRAERFRRSLAVFNNARARNANAAVGALLLGMSIFGLSQYLQFPGWWALLPTLGTSLLIAAGSNTFINRVLLGNRLMVFVGLVSYPLYLWHWPLLALQRILAGAELATADLLLTLALAFVLSWATYRFVERPVRKSRRRFAAAVPLAAGVALIGVIGYLSYLRIVAPRSAAFGFERIIAVTALQAFPGAHLQESAGGINPVLVQGQSRHKVLFLGDSQMQQYYPRIDALLSADPSGTKSAVFSTHGGCPPIPHVKENQLPWCDGLIEQGIRLAQDPAVDTVVVAADWAGYFLGVSSDHLPYYVEGAAGGLIGESMTSAAAAQAWRAFEGMVRDFTKAGKTVYIVLPSTVGEIFRPRRMISRGLTDLSFRLRTPVISTSQVVTELRPITLQLRRIAADTGAIAIDPIAELCNASTCPVLSADGEPIHQDAAHLNPQFVKYSIHYLDGVVKLDASPPVRH